jgi:hypothetical protein
MELLYREWANPRETDTLLEIDLSQICGGISRLKFCHVGYAAKCGFDHSEGCRRGKYKRVNPKLLLHYS